VYENDIAHPEIVQKNKCGESAIVELLVEVFLLLNDLYLGCSQCIDKGIVPLNADEVNGQLLVRRLEIKLQLRDIGQACCCINS